MTYNVFSGTLNPTHFTNFTSNAAYYTPVSVILTTQNRWRQLTITDDQVPT